jgi:hypothetical protein
MKRLVLGILIGVVLGFCVGYYINVPIYKISVYFNFTKDLIVTISVAIGAWVAVPGLNTWKKQFAGKEKYNSARNLLKGTYELRSALSYVRSPFMESSEMPEPPEDHHLSGTPDKRYLYGVSKAYETRWEKVIKASTSIDTELLEGEVLFGSDIRGKFENLIKLRQELYYNILLHLELINPDDDTTLTSNEKKTKRKILYGRGNEKDEFFNKIKEAISEIEDVLRPFITKL